MAQGDITIHMDESLKRQAEQLFSELGMNMTTAITIFTKQAVREQRIPFEIALEVPNRETRMAIEEVENHRNLSRAFDTVEELMEDLNA